MANVTRYTCGSGDGMFENPEGYWIEHSKHQEILDKIREYIFNTATPGDNISHKYYAQTVKFLFELTKES